ncbi:hypothetical protein Pmani_017294 [Petrolisthes manimaculis]|uniref:Uncharacterized protein n=1 Tax=Petrolisthes manimaculis TaxID=1843537 RepID=A0AAE1PM45_9EUCA|nr:hypothetical protein Pmani_017294 [Petrolisthes manimaculis]
MVMVMVVVMVMFGVMVEGRGIEPHHLHISTTTTGNHHQQQQQQQQPIGNLLHHYSTKSSNIHHHQQPPSNLHHLFTTTTNIRRIPSKRLHHQQHQHQLLHPQHLPADPHTHVSDTVVGNECRVCPSISELNPCECRCVNATTAEVTCGPELTSCTQLTDVLTLTNFPSNLYIRLAVNQTDLECILREDLWGPVQFQEIHLVDNLFHTLDNNAFTPFTTSLTLLNLDGNLLQNVYFPALSQVPSLETLSLAHNLISFLPGYFPFSLPRLRSLSLAHNKLTQLQQKSFAELPSLESLDLSHNLLTTLYPDAFTIPQHKASHLYIDLSYNSISTIQEGVLVGSKTCDINLQYNSLSTLDEHIFRPVIDTCGLLSRIQVIGNPFTCDTRLCWVAKNKTISNAFDPIRCQNYNNQLLSILSPFCYLNQRPTESP